MDQWLLDDAKARHGLDSGKLAPHTPWLYLGAWQMETQVLMIFLWHKIPILLFFLLEALHAALPYKGVTQEC